MGLRLGIDLDGVVYDFPKWAKRYLVERKGYWSDQLPDAEVWNFFELQWFMSRKVFESYMGEAVDEKYLWVNGPPIDGAVDALRQLKSQGHEIHIVTARFYGTPGKATENTMLWLARWGIPFDSLTFSADKTSVPVDLFIDDSPDNIRDLCEEGIPAVIFDQPWNDNEDMIQLQDAFSGPRRVRDWQGFVSLVERIHEDRMLQSIRPPEPVGPTLEYWRKEAEDFGLCEPVPDVAGRDLGPFGVGFTRFADEQVVADVRPGALKGETPDLVLLDEVHAAIDDRIAKDLDNAIAAQIEASFPQHPQGIETRIVDPTTGGAKGSKPCQPGWLAPAGLKAVGDVAGFGAKKYAPTNFRRGYKWSLSINAAYRHLLAIMDGEDYDTCPPECPHFGMEFPYFDEDLEVVYECPDHSGLPHAAHLAWHGLTLVQFLIDHPELDDRFGGPAEDKR